MSRELPARPNLEYLKKQAKDLLTDLQQSNSDAQLVDAQFALAREYGFSPRGAGVVCSKSPGHNTPGMPAASHTKCPRMARP